MSFAIVLWKNFANLWDYFEAISFWMECCCRPESEEDNPALSSFVFVTGETSPSTLQKIHSSYIWNFLYAYF